MPSEIKKVAVSTGLLLCAVVLMSVNLRSPIVAFGPVVSMIQQDLHTSGFTMGLIASLPMMAFAVFSPLAAKLSHRWGMVNILIIAIVLMMVGIILRSAAPSLLTLFGGTLLLSAAIAMANVLLPALAKQNMPTQVSLVVGVLSATMSVSSAIAAAVAVPLAKWQNWQWSLGVWVLAAVAALGIWLYLRPKLKVAMLSEQPISDGINVWKSKSAWLLSIFMGVQSLGFYSIVNFLPAVLQEKGFSEWAAGSQGSLFQMTSLIGVIAVSMLMSRSYHKQGIMLSVTAILAVSMFGIWLGGSDGMWLWVSLAGIGSSGAFSIILMLFAMRTDSPKEAAALSGMAQSVGYLIAILGPLGMGMVHDMFGSWTAAIGIVAMLMIAECALSWCAANPKTIAQSDRKNAG